MDSHNLITKELNYEYYHLFYITMLKIAKDFLFKPHLFQPTHHTHNFTAAAQLLYEQA